MKKLIFILLCFSLLTFGSSARIIEVAPAGAWGIIGISGGSAVVAASWEIDNDFSGTYATDWTTVSGSFSYSSGELLFPNTGTIIYNTDFTNAFQQYAKVKVVDASEDYMDFYFRVIYANETAYKLLIRVSTNTVSWFDGDTWGTQQLVEGPVAFTTNTYVGAEIYGTGTDTEARVWAWASDPGARANWDTGYTSKTVMTNNPSHAYNTAVTFGLGSTDNWGTFLLDDLQAGSAAAP